MRQAPHTRMSVDDLHMTPMIDVIFQLLIFFLVTSGFEKPEFIFSTPLPEIQEKQEGAGNPLDNFEAIELELSASNDSLTIVLNNRLVENESELLEQLKGLAAIKRDNPVLLTVQDGVVIDHFIRIYDLLKVAGLFNISIVI